MPSSTPWCWSYWKGSLWVTFDNGRQLTYTYGLLWWKWLRYPQHKITVKFFYLCAWDELRLLWLSSRKRLPLPRVDRVVPKSIDESVFAQRNQNIVISTKNGYSQADTNLQQQQNKKGLIIPNRIAIYFFIRLRSLIAIDGSVFVQRNSEYWLVDWLVAWLVLQCVNPYWVI